MIGEATITMPSLSLAAQKIALFEGFGPKSYKDSAGIWTIGYGTTHYPDGHAVSADDPEITPTQALTFLEHDLQDAASNLWRFVTRQPTLNEWSALVSLAYNVGWPNIARSTALRLFNQGDLEGAANAFLMWDKAHVDGQLVEIAGLHNRRMAERTLFLTPDGEV